MASNNKYGVTFKTSDGKSKSIAGLNLGESGYTENQVVDFINRISETTNKEVLSIDVTNAKRIAEPERKKVRKK